MKRNIVIIIIMAILICMPSGNYCAPSMRFNIVEVSFSDYTYTVYDNRGTILDSDTVYNWYPEISYVRGDILSIRHGVGTGTWQSRYIDTVKGKVSEWFDTPFASDGKWVAYFELDDEQVRYLVIQEIFGSDRRIYYGDFAQWATSGGIDIHHEWRKNALYLEYYDIGGDLRYNTFILPGCRGGEHPATTGEPPRPSEARWFFGCADRWVGGGGTGAAAPERSRSVRGGAGGIPLPQCTFIPSNLLHV